MVEHIFSVVPGIYHTAVMTEQVEERMDGEVDYLNVYIVSENFLLNSGFKQAPGHTEIADLAWFGELLKDFLMIFFEIIEESGTHSHHLINGHFDDPEEGFNGIFRLINQLMSFLSGLVLIKLNDFQQEGILVLELFVYGTLGYSHLLRQ